MDMFFGSWDLGKLISDTFNIYKKNWLNYIAAVALFVILGALVEWGLRAASGGWSVLPGFYYPGAWTWGGFFAAVGFGVLFLVISTIIDALMICAAIYITGIQYLEQNISISNAVGAAVKKVVPVILVGIVRAIVVAALFITIIGIPFAIYLAVKWLFVSHAILFEGKGISESLSRSSDLVKNNWWRIVVYIIVVAIIVGVITWILGYIPVVGSAIGTIIATPITVIATTLLYFTLRVEKEQYNVTQLKADMDGWNTDKKPDYSTVPNAAGYCPHCGEERTEGARFCSNCGKGYSAAITAEDIAKPNDTTAT